MKKFILKARTVRFLFIFFIFLFMNFTINASAHPASDIILVYDYNNQQLNVTITHNVGNPESHYINNIVIRKNNEIYNNYDYTSQPSTSSFTYFYYVNATNGDEIQVFADCNLGGSITKEILVTLSVTTTNGSSNVIYDITYYPIFGIPFIVYIGIITLFIFILTAGLAILKRKGKINYQIKWHIRLAYIAIILGIIHGILGVLVYI